MHQVLAGSAGILRCSFAFAFLLVPFPGMAQSPEDHEGTRALPEGLSASEWSDIRQAYEAERHALRATDSGLRARNPGQRWLTLFDGRGFSTQPDACAWTWGLELVRYGFAGSERDVERPQRVRADGPRASYEWDSTLREWFVNDARGLEHGFSVQQRPRRSAADGDHGPLLLTLGVRGGLTAEVRGDGRDVVFADELGVARVTYSGLTVFDADGEHLPARFEPADEGLRLIVDERGARYPLTIDPIAQQAYLKASNTGGGDEFGTSVAVWGDTIVVGARFEDSNATGVGGDQTNNSAANAGAAYVFVRSGASWSQEAYLKASNTETNDEFGTRVAISGDTIVVGAYREDSSATGVNGNQADNGAFQAGAAYVFTRSGTSWSQEAYLKASNTDSGDEFGFSVTVAGDTIVVGAYAEDSNATGVNGDETDNSELSAGAAYVFVRSGTVWSQEAYLKASNTDDADLFGLTTALSGDTALIGATGEDSSATGVNGNQANNTNPTAGAAYVFTRSGTTWSQEAYLKASNTGAGDVFGSGVALDGDSAVIGAQQEESNATGVNGNQGNNSAIRSGAAYVFVRSGAVWSQEAYLKASNTGAFDGFGSSVALAGDWALVGAPSESSSATGVNGDQGNDSAPLSGAAYLFRRSGTSWSQEAYLKSSNSEASDFFGSVAALSNDTAVVASIWEDSSASGVNGNQSSNGGPQSGAAYVFDFNASVGTFCRQAKSTSVAGCVPALYATGPSLSTDFWTVDDVPLGPGSPSTIGIFLYTQAPGTGMSPFTASTPFGTLCLASFFRSSPACSALTLSGTPNTCGNSFAPFSPDCNGGALGILAGDDVNAQAWYRDPANPGSANFTNAIFYTAAP